MGYYVTITGVPAGFYTDQWFIDDSDGWTAGDLNDNICESVPCGAGAHTLEKDAVELNLGGSIASQTSSGDTLDHVES